MASAAARAGTWQYGLWCIESRIDFYWKPRKTLRKYSIVQYELRTELPDIIRNRAATYINATFRFLFPINCTNFYWYCLLNLVCCFHKSLCMQHSRDAKRPKNNFQCSMPMKMFEWCINKVIMEVRQEQDSDSTTDIYATKLRFLLASKWHRFRCGIYCGCMWYYSKVILCAHLLSFQRTWVNC